MEGLLKQVRKFSGKEEIGSFREGKTLPQRTPSFTGERKPQKWLKRQFSRQMSSNHSIEEAEYAAAIAAAAFAITALDSNAVDRVKPDLERRPSLSKIFSGLINPAFSAEPPKRHAAENESEASRMPKKRLTFADEVAEDHLNHSAYGTPVYSEEELEEPKRMEPASTPPYARMPTVKKTPSFGEEEFEDAQRMKPTSTPSSNTPILRKAKSFEEETMEEAKLMKSPKRPSLQPSLPPTIPPPPAIPPLNIQPVDLSKRAQRPRESENDADAWERTEMAKIKQRYEKLSSTILEWEDKKKKKARRKLEMTEKEPENKRVKAMHNYQLQMDRIKQIAEGARAQAKDKYRNEELKVREKASIYRETGDPPQPPMCLCL